MRDIADVVALLAYMTFPSHALAVSIGRALVEAHLAAGVNIIPAAFSVYRWEGQIRQRDECVAFAQTTEAVWEDLVAFIRARHTDIEPCIVAVEITDGFSPFLEWIDQNTCLCDLR